MRSVEFHYDRKLNHEDESLLHVTSNRSSVLYCQLYWHSYPLTLHLLVHGLDKTYSLADYACHFNNRSADSFKFGSYYSEIQDQIKHQTIMIHLN